MMAKGDGLRALQMGIARHHRALIVQSFLAEHLDQFLDLPIEHAALFAQVQAVVQRHLVVPAAGCVQALSGVPQAGCELRFHKGVDVLGLRVDLQRAGFQIRQDAF